MNAEWNPLRYPMCFTLPNRSTEIDAWHRHMPFAFFCMQVLRPRAFVELGVHRGDSYCAFCQAVEALGLPTQCYGIDTWQGDEHAGFYGPEVLEELRSHHDILYGRFSRLVQSTFDGARADFPDHSVDLLHIDGMHSYEAVTRDFEGWLPKLSERGVVLLHDTHVRERQFGVWRLWEELKRRYPSFEFAHGHGLGVLAVGGNVCPELLAFLSMDEDSRQAVSRLFFALGDRVALAGRQARMTRAIAEREGQIAELRTRLNALQGSLSWRITAPLRVLRARQLAVTRRWRARPQVAWRFLKLAIHVILRPDPLIRACNRLRRSGL